MVGNVFAKDSDSNLEAEDFKGPSDIFTASKAPYTASFVNAPNYRATLTGVGAGLPLTNVTGNWSNAHSRIRQVYEYGVIKVDWGITGRIRNNQTGEVIRFEKSN